MKELLTIVLLGNEGESLSNLIIRNDKLEITPFKGNDSRNHHLYLVRQEFCTAEDDVTDKWYYSDYGFIIQADKIEDGYLFHKNSKGNNYVHNYREIAVSTDPVLNLAEPDEDFVKEYVDRFNKGERIDEVSVGDVVNLIRNFEKDS